MMSAGRAVCYCQAICANKQFEAATPLSRDELWQEGLGRKSPEDAAVEETCVAHVGTARGGLSLWWAQPTISTCPPGTGREAAAHDLCCGLAFQWDSPKDSGSTCGCSSQVSNARLVLDLISGIPDAGRD